MSALLEARGVVVELGGRRIVDSVDLRLGAGERVAMIGANGSGKSTLLRALLGVAPIARGTVELEGAPLASLRRDAIARRITMVAQDTHLDLPLTVRELVEIGRFPHRGSTPEHARASQAAIEGALRDADVHELAARDVRTLSGGELQRAHLARALAQSTRVLLLDEPTSSLDLRHQLDLLERLASLAARGHAVLATLHDLSLAATWASRIVVLDGGRLLADGTPREVLATQLVSRALRVEVAMHELEGRLVVVPTRSPPDQAAR